MTTMSGVQEVPVAESQAGSGATPAVPEHGQVVEVRGSTWAVANVREQGLPRSPADESRAEINHVVSLQSLDGGPPRRRVGRRLGTGGWPYGGPRSGFAGADHSGGL